ncbi:MAG: diguanylate cyclase [Gammaproteobacteria bacterium]
MKQLEQLKLGGQLPSPRGVALAILEISRRDNATLADIARVVQTDPALSSRLIKLSNTASHISRPVVSVQEAVVRQGMNTVRQLALGFSLVDQYRDGACKGFDYQRYWSHSLLMALGMQALGARVHVAPQDELFILGLLAQVGKLALATIYPKDYGEILLACHTDPETPLIAQERRKLETDHIELGIAMMTDWGMPRVFTAPLAHYEAPQELSQPRDSRSASLMLMLRLSHRLADLGLAESDARAALAKEWIAEAVQIDLPQEDAGTFIDAVIASWQEWGKLLNIPATALPSIAEICHGQVLAEEDAAERDTALRIVIADANAESRHRLMAMLSEDGAHFLYPAENGTSALALAMDVLPHVIVAHYDLPLLDGLELCQALRATEEGRRMHILLTSGDSREDELSRAYEAGADGFVPASVTPDGLRTRLQAAQRQVRLQGEWEKDRAQLRQIAAELAVANRRLATVALTDLLTGLPNRRSAMDQLEQAWSAASRSGMPLAVMLIDIDHFKSINDAYGHATGDLVLREAAAAMRSAARREDSVCRFGGEEFLVICPNTDLQSALHSAERLRKMLANKRIGLGQTSKTITASIGVAVREPDTADIDALVSAADQALYEAKGSGRDRTCIHTAPAKR